MIKDVCCFYMLPWHFMDPGKVHCMETGDQNAYFLNQHSTSCLIFAFIYGFVLLRSSNCDGAPGLAKQAFKLEQGSVSFP